MALFWFLAGVLTTLSTLAVMLPWLRKSPRFGSLPAVPWRASLSVVVMAAAILGGVHWLAQPKAAPQPAAIPSSAFGNAAKAFASATSGPTDPAKTPPAAGSMNSAIANLESRLAKGGGTDGDWELLAKSFEFLGRPADAAKARARQLPTVPTDDGPGGPPVASDRAAAVLGSASASSATADAATAKSATAATGAAVSGEITLAPALKAKAAAGETLFIVAKSVDSPGVPVAVFRGSVGSWPLKFTLDDSQSMLPGRNLSNAGRVTVEARISQKGQPLPASGDLQGSTGVINPADHQPLKILIDRVIS
jgi:hypothetical protein